jgi:hypothetical protein
MNTVSPWFPTRIDFVHRNEIVDGTLKKVSCLYCGVNVVCILNACVLAKKRSTRSTNRECVCHMPLVCSQLAAPNTSSGLLITEEQQPSRSPSHHPSSGPIGPVNNLIIVRAWYGGPHKHRGKVYHGSSLEHGWLWQTGDRKGKDVTAILLSNVRNGELNFNPERRRCNDLFGFDPAPQCYKILVVQYKYGESGLVQTWFSESVGDESYHCYLPASPPPLAVRIVLPNGIDDASRDTVLGAVVKVLATKGFSVEVSPSSPDVFILSAESAPRIEELLHPALPHRIKGVDVVFREQAPPGGSSAVCIVLPNGIDDASRDKVLGSVVKVLATKGFSVEVSPSSPDVFILSAESAPRIEELLHPVLPHRIKGVDVIFHARCAFPRRDASAKEEPWPEIVHIYGINPHVFLTASTHTEELMSYLTAKGLAPPKTVVWVNDSSANVVFSDARAAAAALQQLTVPLFPNAQGIDTTSWRTLPIVEKGRQLLFRLATASDFPPERGPCKHWLKGRCVHGRACRWAHDETDRNSRRGSARVGPPRWSPSTASPSSASPRSASPRSASPRSASPRSASPSSASPRSAPPSLASPSSASPSLASPSSASPSLASPRSASPVSGAQPGADRPRPTMSSELLTVRVDHDPIVRQSTADEPPQLERITGAYRVTLHKPDASARLGITLINNDETHAPRGPPAPIITALAPGCLAADSGRITINQLLVAVNGQRVHTHEEATALLRNAVGDVELTLTASGRGSGGLVPPVAGGTVVDDVLGAVAASTAAPAPAASPSTPPPPPPPRETPSPPMAKYVSELLAARGSCIPGTAFKQCFREHHGFELDLGKGKLQDFLKLYEGLGVCKLEMRPMPNGSSLLFVHALRATAPIWPPMPPGMPPPVPTVRDVPPPSAVCSRKAFVVLPKMSDPSEHARAETALSRHFGLFGAVVSCRVRAERGCGFVEWTTPEAAARALAVPKHVIDELRPPSGSYSFDVLVVPYRQEKGMAPAPFRSIPPIWPPMPPGMPPPIWPGMPPPIWPGMPPPIWPGMPGRGGILPIWPG